LRAVRLKEELLHAAGLRERKLTGLAGCRENFDLPIDETLHLRRVERRVRVVRQANVLLSGDETLLELGAIDGDTLALPLDLHVQPVHPARDPGAHLDRFASELNAHELFRDVELPGLRERADSLRPEPERHVAVGLEGIPAFARTQTAVEQLLDGLLL